MRYWQLNAYQPGDPLLNIFHRAFSFARMSGFESLLRPFGAVVDSDLEVDEDDTGVDSDSDEIEYLGTRPRDIPRVDTDDEDDDEEVVYLGTRPRNLVRRQSPDLPDSNSASSKLPAQQKKISGECPICYEEFEPTNEEIVWCKATCGNNVHRACFEAWRQRHSPEELCCVFCSTPWLSDDDPTDDRMIEEDNTMLDITDEDLIDYSTDEDSSSDDSEEDRMIGLNLGLLGPCGFPRITCCAMLSNADAYTDDVYPWDRPTAI